jgi:phosphoribosylglycinamide formyltransferase
MADEQQSPCRILVMASGNGSNFQALINAVAAGRIPNSKIVRLIVTRKGIRYNPGGAGRYPVGVLQPNK